RCGAGHGTACRGFAWLARSPFGLVQLEARGGADGGGLQQRGRARLAVRRRLDRDGAFGAAGRAAVDASEAVKRISHLGAASNLAKHRRRPPCWFDHAPCTCTHCACGIAREPTQCFYRPDKLSRSERTFTEGIIG